MIRDKFLYLNWLGLLLAALACATPVGAADHVLDPGLLASNWTDDSGKPMTLSQLRGKSMVITMGYAACRKTCSTTLLVLKEIQKVLEQQGRAAEFVMVTYAPEADAPRAWAEYRKSRGLDRTNWHFLSGSVQDTRRMASMLDLNFWSYDEHIMHDFRVVIFDADGKFLREVGWLDVGHLAEILAHL